MPQCPIAGDATGLTVNETYSNRKNSQTSIHARKKLFRVHCVKVLVMIVYNAVTYQAQSTQIITDGLGFRPSDSHL